MTVQLSLRYELNYWRKASATFLPEATERGLIASNLLIPSLRGNPQQPSHGQAHGGRLLLVEAVHSNPDGAHPLEWSAAVGSELASEPKERPSRRFCSG